MRVMRSSVYPDPYSEPVTIVVRDSDVRDTLENIHIQSIPSDGLVVCDIFQMHDGPIQAATQQALRRMHKDRIAEKHMAMLFHWTLKYFPRISDGGFIDMDKPAPLKAKDIEYVFDQLKQQPSYRNFHITAIAKDGTRVVCGQGLV